MSLIFCVFMTNQALPTRWVGLFFFSYGLVLIVLVNYSRVYWKGLQSLASCGIRKEEEATEGSQLWMKPLCIQVAGMNANRALFRSWCLHTPTSIHYNSVCLLHRYWRVL